ncbi:MAG: type II toxin-antitoxin system RelE/ParE family toxin [Verrucomicrobiales bacterium]
MRLIWTTEARDDLAAAFAYVSTDNPKAGARLVLRIGGHIARQLTRFPESGRPGRIEGTRELVGSGTPYVVPYRVSGETVTILRVYHGARKWPEGL